MSSRYTADGKRKSSMVHANRKWTCICGRQVTGNGGRSSHQRACLVYMEYMVAFHEARIKEILNVSGPEWSLDRHRWQMGQLQKEIEARRNRLNQSGETAQ